MKIPWGAWDWQTGQWVPNHRLKMNSYEQHEINVRNGYSCQHMFMPTRCPFCSTNKDK